MYFSSFVFFVTGIVLLIFVPLIFLACYKWRKLTAKTTNYVVNGASQKVIADQKQKNGNTNEALEKDVGISKVENGKVTEQNGNGVSKMENGKTTEKNGNHIL